MVKLLELPFFKKKPWFLNANSIWMLTHFELHRNLKNHFFPNNLEIGLSEKLSEMMTQVLLSCPLVNKAVSFQANQLTPDEKQLLYEYFFSQKSFSQYHGAETFIIEPSGDSYTTINFEDHLHFHRLDTSENLEETWTELLKLECHLSENFEFAYSQKFGFATSNQNLCGTGLVIKTLLHLPALIHLGELQNKLQSTNRNFLNIEPFGGSFDLILGDLMFISNRQTLGVSEETLLKNIRRVTLEFSLAEKTLREHLTTNQEVLLKDKVGKAFGILRHSSKLLLNEALSQLSLCKLGIEMGWIKGLTIEEINSLFFSVRKGFLKLNNPQKTNLDFESLRSKYLHKKGDQMTFTV
ncbi:MAG: Protein-arginine kinase [Chlamydiae bacterium]|nr:Protein-arginine kinase [Chlamydiota bacterium]